METGLAKSIFRFRAVELNRHTDFPFAEGVRSIMLSDPQR
jgi:hypothetical protein